MSMSYVLLNKSVPVLFCIIFFYLLISSRVRTIPRLAPSTQYLGFFTMPMPTANIGCDAIGI